MTAEEGRWDYVEGDEPEQHYDYDPDELERARMRMKGEKDTLNKEEDLFTSSDIGMDYQKGQEEIDGHSPEEMIEREHELMGEKPEEKEQTVHDILKQEFGSEEEDECENCERKEEYLNDDGLCEDCEREQGIDRIESMRDAYEGGVGSGRKPEGGSGRHPEQIGLGNQEQRSNFGAGQFMAKNPMTEEAPDDIDSDIFGKEEDEDKTAYDDMKYKKDTLDKLEPWGLGQRPEQGFDYQKGGEDVSVSGPPAGTQPPANMVDDELEESPIGEALLSPLMNYTLDELKTKLEDLESERYEFEFTMDLVEKDYIHKQYLQDQINDIKEEITERELNDAYESKATEGVVEKIYQDGWEFSVIDSGYGGGWAGTAEGSDNNLEVGIFSPEMHPTLGIPMSKIKGWMTQAEVDELKRQFQSNPESAYKSIGGEVKTRAGESVTSWWGGIGDSEFRMKALKEINADLDLAFNDYWELPNEIQDELFIIYSEGYTGEAYDDSEHPRGGNPDNTGQFSKGSGGSGGKDKPKEKKKFTLASYRRNETRNAHGANALNLVKQYGTPEEVKELEGINKRHKEKGSLNGDDYNRRYEISQKYYKNLVEDSKKPKEVKPKEEDEDTVWERSHGLPEGQAKKNRIKSQKDAYDMLSDKNQERFDKLMKGKDLEDLTNKQLRKLWVKTGSWDRDDSKILAKHKDEKNKRKESKWNKLNKYERTQDLMDKADDSGKIYGFDIREYKDSSWNELPDWVKDSFSGESYAKETDPDCDECGGDGYWDIPDRNSEDGLRQVPCEKCDDHDQYDTYDESKATEASSDYNDIGGVHRKVTYTDNRGQTRTGNAVMKGPAGWVVNSGNEANPDLVDETNFISVEAKASESPQVSSDTWYTDYSEYWKKGDSYVRSGLTLSADIPSDWIGTEWDDLPADVQAKIRDAGYVTSYETYDKMSWEYLPKSVKQKLGEGFTPTSESEWNTSTQARRKEILTEEFDDSEHPRGGNPENKGQFSKGGGSSGGKHSDKSEKDLIKAIKGGSKDWNDWGRNEKNEELYAEIEKRNKEVPYPKRPESAKGGSIFRDDPDAVPKMEAKVKYLEDLQDYWKTIIKFPHRDYQNHDQLGDAKWYAMSNNGANLRDAKKKLAGIKAQQSSGTQLVRKPTYKSDQYGKSKPRFYYSEEPSEKMIDFIKSKIESGVPTVNVHDMLEKEFKGADKDQLRVAMNMAYDQIQGTTSNMDAYRKNKGESYYDIVDILKKKASEVGSNPNPSIDDSYRQFVEPTEVPTGKVIVDQTYGVSEPETPDGQDLTGKTIGQEDEEFEERRIRGLIEMSEMPETIEDVERWAVSWGADEELVKRVFEREFGTYEGDEENKLDFAELTEDELEAIAYGDEGEKEDLEGYHVDPEYSEEYDPVGEKDAIDTDDDKVLDFFKQTGDEEIIEKTPPKIEYLYYKQYPFGRRAGKQNPFGEGFVGRNLGDDEGDRGWYCNHCDTEFESRAGAKIHGDVFVNHLVREYSITDQEQHDAKEINVDASNIRGLLDLFGDMNSYINSNPSGVTEDELRNKFGGGEEFEHNLKDLINGGYAYKEGNLITSSKPKELYEAKEISLDVMHKARIWWDNKYPERQWSDMRIGDRQNVILAFLRDPDTRINEGGVGSGRKPLHKHTKDHPKQELGSKFGWKNYGIDDYIDKAEKEYTKGNEWLNDPQEDIDLPRLKELEEKDRAGTATLDERNEQVTLMRKYSEWTDADKSNPYWVSLTKTEAKEFDPSILADITPWESIGKLAFDTAKDIMFPAKEDVEHKCPSDDNGRCACDSCDTESDPHARAIFCKTCNRAVNARYEADEWGASGGHQKWNRTRKNLSPDELKISKTTFKPKWKREDILKQREKEREAEEGSWVRDIPDVIKDVWDTVKPEKKVFYDDSWYYDDEVKAEEDGEYRRVIDEPRTGDDFDFVDWNQRREEERNTDEKAKAYLKKIKHSMDKGGAKFQRGGESARWSGDQNNPNRDLSDPNWISSDGWHAERSRGSGWSGGGGSKFKSLWKCPDCGEKFKGQGDFIMHLDGVHDYNHYTAVSMGNSSYYTSEGGLGSGKKDHKSWMRAIEEEHEYNFCDKCSMITEQVNKKCQMCGKKVSI